MEIQEKNQSETFRKFFYELECRGYTFSNKNWNEATLSFENPMLNMAWEMFGVGQVTGRKEVKFGRAA